MGWGGGREEREAGLLMTWCCVAEAASSDRPVLHTDSLITVITPPRRPLADSPLVAEEKRLWRQGSVMIPVYGPKLQQE